MCYMIICNWLRETIPYLIYLNFEEFRFLQLWVNYFLHHRKISMLNFTCAISFNDDWLVFETRVVYIMAKFPLKLPCWQNKCWFLNWLLRVWKSWSYTDWSSGVGWLQDGVILSWKNWGGLFCLPRSHIVFVWGSWVINSEVLFVSYFFY